MYAWRIIYGIGVEIGVRDVLIFDEYKKRNEHPFSSPKTLLSKKPIS